MSIAQTEFMSAWRNVKTQATSPVVNGEHVRANPAANLILELRRQTQRYHRRQNPAALANLQSAAWKADTRKTRADHQPFLVQDCTAAGLASGLIAIQIAGGLWFGTPIGNCGMLPKNKAAEVTGIQFLSAAFRSQQPLIQDGPHAGQRVRQALLCRKVKSTARRSGGPGSRLKCGSNPNRPAIPAHDTVAGESCRQKLCRSAGGLGN